MIKKLTKTNISLLIIILCVLLCCGLFSLNNSRNDKVSIPHAEGTSATLKGYVSSSSDCWYGLIDYNIENLIITNSFDINTATGEPVDVSAEQNGSLYAYKIDNGDGTYNCVIYADVDKIYAPNNSSYLFKGYSTKLSSVKTITFENNCFDTSNATNMSYMFYNLHQLHTLDVSKFNTDKVTDMSEMFVQCKLLQTIDVSNFVTTQVTSMESMFNDCETITTLNLKNFNTSNVTNMRGMFMNCYNLSSLDLSNFDTKKVTDMENMFSDCGAETINLSSFVTSNVKKMSSMFTGCKVSILDLKNFDTAQVTDMSTMFTGCYASTIDLSSFVTTNVTSMQMMFSGCTNITQLNLSNFDTKNVTAMSYMFGGCKNLIKLNISGFDLSSIENESAKNMLGLSDDEILAQFGSMISDGQTIDEWIDANPDNTYAAFITMMRASKNLQELVTPNVIGSNVLYLSPENKLYIEGNESTPLTLITQSSTGAEYYQITSAEQGVVLKSLNSSDTPSTGFVDEQLLPAIAIGLVSVLAVVYVTFANKKKFNKN